MNDVIKYLLVTVLWVSLEIPIICMFNLFYMSSRSIIFSLIKKKQLSLILFYNAHVFHHYSLCFLVSFQSFQAHFLLLLIFIHLFLLGVAQLMFSFFLLNDHFFPRFLFLIFLYRHN